MIAYQLEIRIPFNEHLGDSSTRRSHSWIRSSFTKTISIQISQTWEVGHTVNLNVVNLQGLIFILVCQ